ncbi:class I SAM-dependent methyltransferase [Nordella sp. HKS 07]|uniref:class I SAM-dependent methyltransferase n=1 Tax=Nordella sp. HKS 07 TaxID=2712222 RepID=UPI0019CFAED3|nr:SAM-dependent methyltransferase [Nordella sp. HKS 07]
MRKPTPLETLIIAMIREDGPMPLDRYMALCLGHPVHGYYMSRDPFGPEGDFITAPEISQIFGELIGIWAAAAFQALGAPAAFHLVELGPGRGTLMSDILRSSHVMPGFRDAARIHLVETSPALRKQQADRLGTGVIWHESIATLPEGPAIVIANEFFDALPIRQFEARDRQWMERRVGLGADGGMVVGLAAQQLDRPPAADGTILEMGSSRDDIARELGARFVAGPGAALIIDYGHVASGFGDTLQAVRRHKFCSILDRPGEADLTSHVDFESLRNALAQGGAVTHGPITQRQFLLSMGLEARASLLSQRAKLNERKVIGRAVERLAGDNQMGNLFKVMAATSPGLSTPYPFGSR